MNASVKADALELVVQSYNEVAYHLRRQFGELKAAERNLQAGILAKNVCTRLRKSQAKPSDVWIALYANLFRPSEVTPFVYIPNQFTLDLGVILSYLVERDNLQGSQKFDISYPAWIKLFETKTREKQIHEIKRLCDWEEAFIAVDAYVLFKQNKNCYNADWFKSFVNILASRLSNYSPSLHTQAYRAGMDNLRAITKTELPDLHAAQLYEEAASEWKTPRLDRWLFRVWPLVKHYDWNFKELHGVVIEKLQTVLQVDSESYPCKTPDTLGQHCRLVLGLKHEERRAGRPSRSGKIEDIPRVQLAYHLHDTD